MLERKTLVIVQINTTLTHLLIDHGLSKTCDGIKMKLGTYFFPLGS